MVENPPPSRATTFLARLATLLLVAGLGFGTFVLGRALLGMGNDLAVHQTVEPAQLDGLPPSVIRPGHVAVTIRVDEPDRGQQLLGAARDAGPILLTLAILWLARGILRSVRDGEPFTESNVRRLRGIALLCIIGGPLVAVITDGLDNALAATSTVGELGNTFDLSLGGPFIGLAVFVLAEIFARGVRLRDDVEGTV